MRMTPLPLAAMAINLMAAGCARDQNPRPLSPATPSAPEIPTPAPSSPAPSGAPDANPNPPPGITQPPSSSGSQG
jgi:hypothetical protein